MAAAVAKTGHDVTIVTTDLDMEAADWDAVARWKSDGLSVRVLPAVGRGALHFSPPLYWALDEAIPKADVVHLHSLYLFHCWAVGRLCRKYAVPYILCPHGTLDPLIFYRRRVRKKLIELLFQDRVTKGAAAIHFTAEEEARLARPFIFGRPEFIVSNGVNIDEFDALPSTGRFGEMFPEVGRSPYILFLGRMNFKKGLEILAAGFGALAQEDPDLRLVIAGPADHSMREKVEAWLDEHGVKERTVFTGMLRGNTKLAALRDAAIFVLPSYSENFGIAIIEAMACGTPVVTTDRVNIWREISATGAARISIPEKEPFTTVLRAAFHDSDWRERARAEGPRIVAELFDWQRVASKLEDMYLDVRGKQDLTKRESGGVSGLSATR